MLEQVVHIVATAVPWSHMQHLGTVGSALFRSLPTLLQYVVWGQLWGTRAIWGGARGVYAYRLTFKAVGAIFIRLHSTLRFCA
jgi:hypothetical protein